MVEEPTCECCGHPLTEADQEIKFGYNLCIPCRNYCNHNFGESQLEKLVFESRVQREEILSMTCEAQAYDESAIKEFLR